MVSGEEDHRDGVHSYHIVSGIPAVNLTFTVEVDTEHLAEVLYCTSCSFSPLSIQNLLEGTHCVPPTLRG